VITAHGTVSRMTGPETVPARFHLSMWISGTAVDIHELMDTLEEGRKAVVAKYGHGERREVIEALRVAVVAACQTPIFPGVPGVDR